MPTRYLALIYGVVFLLVGIAGFIPGITQPAVPGMEAIEHGLLLGLFPVNAAHNLVHVVFGIWGLVAYRGLRSSFIYACAVAVIYAVLTIMGLVPGLRTMFGIAPLFGHDVWLHAVLALGAAYFAYVGRRDARLEAGTARG